jgi:hypothetical protein
LGAFADPIFGPIELQGAVMAGLFRIIGTDDLDKLAVAWASFICHHDFIIGAIQRPFSS